MDKDKRVVLQAFILGGITALAIMKIAQVIDYHKQQKNFLKYVYGEDFKANGILG